LPTASGAGRGNGKCLQDGVADHLQACGAQLLVLVFSLRPCGLDAVPDLAEEIQVVGDLRPRGVLGEGGEGRGQRPQEVGAVLNPADVGERVDLHGARALRGLHDLHRRGQAAARNLEGQILLQGERHHLVELG
jgi:hypothetical protein